MNQVPPLKFKHLAPEIWGELENIPRTGWVMWQIPHPETVAEHIQNLRGFAHQMFDELPELNTAEREEILDMLEVHDWAESLIGDIALEAFPDNAHPRIEQRKLEKERLAMQKITQGLSQDGEYIMRLWEDFVEEKTDVAKIARQIDLLQDIVHAVEYEKKYDKPGLAEEFHSYSGPKITHYSLKSVMEHRLAELSTLGILGVISESYLRLFS